MGADLITFILTGPVKLKCPKTLRAKLLKKAQFIVDAATQAVEDPDFDWQEDKFLKGVAEEEHESISRLDPEEVLNSLLMLWEGGSFRDVSSRVITVGGKKLAIVVAGGESWGDDPDGAGYATIRNAVRLGDMLKALGIN